MSSLPVILGRYDVKRGGALAELAARGVVGGVVPPKIVVALNNIPTIKLGVWANVGGHLRKKVAMLEPSSLSGKDEELIHRRVSARATTVMKDLLQDVPFLEAPEES